MGHPVQPPCRSRLTYSRLHRTLSRGVLDSSREGDSTAFLGSLFHPPNACKGMASAKLLPRFECLLENEVSDVCINVVVNKPVVRSLYWTGLIYTVLITTPVTKSGQSSNANAVSHQLWHLSISGMKLPLGSESTAGPSKSKDPLGYTKPK